MPNNTSISIPEHITGAAFLVQDHVVTQLNSAAQQRQVPLGAKIYELISSGSQEYDSFRSGKLYLQLYIAGVQYNACVSSYKKAHLFCILSDYANKELQALALASSSLKAPLQNALSGADQLSRMLSDSPDPLVHRSFGQINRSLHQLIRSIGNMSDASTYSHSPLLQFQYLNAKALLAEIAEKIIAKIPAGICSIKFAGLTNPVFTQADPQALERAIYNMISNAVKFSPEQSTVSLKVSTKGDRLYITVENPCDTASTEITQFFDRYLREPMIEDTRFGIGLGLSVVRSIAAAHYGTLLVTKKNKNIASFTISVAIREESNSTLKSPFYLKVDHYGGFNVALVELSDILPDEMYTHI